MEIEVEEKKEGLWHNSNFVKLWTSETISQFGSQFTGLALPLTAVIILGASVLELSILTFVGSVSWLVFGLLIGVWVDRHRKQRIMVTSNILRGSLLALIPIAAQMPKLMQRSRKSQPCLSASLFYLAPPERGP